MRIVYHDTLKIIIDEARDDLPRIWTNHPIDEFPEASYNGRLIALGLRERGQSDEAGLLAATPPASNANAGNPNNGQGARGESQRP